MVERSATPRGVERKSAGRSDIYECLFSEGDREEGQEKRAFDPCRDRSSSQKPDAIVREYVATAVCPDKYGKRAAAIHLHAASECHYQRYVLREYKG